MTQDPKRFAQMTLVALLILGCLLVFYPFLAALLFAIVICVSTWPLYERLRRYLKNRDTLSAFVMTLLLTLITLIPTVLLTMNLYSVTYRLTEEIRHWVTANINEISQWLSGLPLIGEQAAEYWEQVYGNQEEIARLLKNAYAPAQTVMLGTLNLIANGSLQLVLVIFIAFFIYRDGFSIGKLLMDAAYRLGGNLGTGMLRLSQATVTGVMLGIVGTALAQALIALIGFLAAGVPGAALLGALTFFLSMFPFGPAIAWGGAAFWLYHQGDTGWAVFMLLYGFFAISGVENFLKPILISRSASLSILLISLGVFGGMLAFGFIGIFLGPTFLALAQTLFIHWLNSKSDPNAIARRIGAL